MPGERLDSIRDQLRALGYLSGPLSGWVVGRNGPLSFLRLNLAASLRAALIGGPMLGLPAAAAVALANRPHIGSPRDLVLLSIYLSAVLGLALGLLEFLADAALAWMARRGFILVGRMERLAGRVALLFTAASTLYLAFLLRGGRPTEGGAGGWLLWGATVVAALAAGHVVGRLTRLGSAISLIAAGATGAVRAPRRRRRWLAAGTLLVMAAAIALLIAPAAPGGMSLGPPSPFTPREITGRIIFIGIDGLDADLLDRLGARGALPGLSRLASGGARMRLEAPDSSVPPVVWTTLATGRPPAEHGVLGYEAARLPGLSTPVQQPPGDEPLRLSPGLLLPPVPRGRLPVSAGLRRAPALWEILADAGVPSAAINWWATWPAMTADGIVVSERALTRFASGSPADRDVAPAALEADLQARFAADMEAVADGLRRAGIGAKDDLATRAAVIDGYHALVAARLFSDLRARGMFVYLPGLDIARAGGAAEDLDPIARHLDACVDRIARGAGPDDLVLIAAQPGRAGDPAGGLLLAAGARVAVNGGPSRLSLYDVAPTVLAFAGFPRARDLPGRAALGLLRPGDPAAAPAASIATYGGRREPLPAPTADPFGREVLDRLRSLGYIQ